MPARLHQGPEPGIGIHHDTLDRRTRFRRGRLEAVRRRLERRGFDLLDLDADDFEKLGDVRILEQHADLLKILGVKIEEIKSSPLKAAPNGFEPTSPEARAAIEAIVSESYAWFKGMVKARRQLDDEMLQRVADGRVFTGRQGIPLKLVDELGDERTAIAWLAKEKNIDPKTPVRDYRLRDRLGDLPFLHTAIVTGLDAVGLGSFARRFEEWGAVQAIERLNLDGLLALWHPPTAN